MSLREIVKKSINASRKYHRKSLRTMNKECDRLLRSFSLNLTLISSDLKPVCIAKGLGVDGIQITDSRRYIYHRKSGCRLLEGVCEPSMA
jgi:hypothetical protein